MSPPSHLPSDHVSAGIRALRKAEARLRRAKKPELAGAIHHIESAIESAVKLMPTGRKPTAAQRARLDRDVSEHAEQVRAMNERMGSLRKLVRDRQAAVEAAAPGLEKWRAQELLDLAKKRLAGAR